MRQASLIGHGLPLQLVDAPLQTLNEDSKQYGRGTEPHDDDTDDDDQSPEGQTDRLLQGVVVAERNVAGEGRHGEERVEGG